MSIDDDGDNAIETADDAGSDGSTGIDSDHVAEADQGDQGDRTPDEPGDDGPGSADSQRASADEADTLDPGAEYDRARDAFEQQSMYSEVTSAPPDMEPITVHVDHAGQPLPDDPDHGTGVEAGAPPSDVDTDKSRGALDRAADAGSAVDDHAEQLNETNATVEAVAKANEEQQDPAVDAEQSGPVAPDWIGGAAMLGTAAVAGAKERFGNRDE